MENNETNETTISQDVKPICQDCINWVKLDDCKTKPFNNPACQFFRQKPGRPANPNKAKVRTGRNVGMPVSATVASPASQQTAMPAQTAIPASIQSSSLGTFNPDDYRVKSNPNIVMTESNQKVFDTMEKLFLSGHDGFFYMQSQAGNGKNELIKKLAEKYNRPLVLISCSGDMSSSSLLGRITALPNGALGWQDGLFTEAMKSESGCIVVLDEFSAMDASITFALHNLPDGYITIANNNQKVMANPKFFLIGTCNPLGYEGVKAINEAWNGRLGIVKMKFDIAIDNAILDRTKLNQGIKQALTQMITLVRQQMDAGKLSKPFGHRTTQQVVNYYNAGIALSECVDIAYLDKLPDYEQLVAKRIMNDFTSIFDFVNE